MFTNPQKNIKLDAYSTMRLGGDARYLLEVHHPGEIPKAIDWAKKNSQKIIMIGGGSNIIWTDDGFDGLVLINKIMGFDLQKIDDGGRLTVGAGEHWDSVVKRAVQAGLSGIEQLSLVPGSAGATPIQNVGAYGREIAEVLISLQAYDTQNKEMVTVEGKDCQFSYRNSRFKSTDKGRFLITSIDLSLSNNPPLPPFYASLQSYLDQHGIHDYSPQNIRDAVIAIRQSKLPDPEYIANCGSFFKNPIISLEQLDHLREKNPEIKYWEVGENQYKISAAWLLEQLGLKDYHDAKTGMATWAKQPLVFVNEHAKNTASLLDFRDGILAKVQKEFNITLETEPELI